MTENSTGGMGRQPGHKPVGEPEHQRAGEQARESDWIEELKALGREYGDIELLIPALDCDLTQLKPLCDFGSGADGGNRDEDDECGEAAAR